MISFFKRLLSNSAWKEGKLQYLLEREATPTAFALSEVAASTTEEALRLFCDAFDIPEEQKYCLRLSDEIHVIYRAMVHGMSDDMEYERLAMNLEEAIGRTLAKNELEAVVTIEHLIRFLQANQKPNKRTTDNSGASPLRV